MRQSIDPVPSGVSARNESSWGLVILFRPIRVHGGSPVRSVMPERASDFRSKPISLGHLNLAHILDEISDQDSLLLPRLKSD